MSPPGRPKGECGARSAEAASMSAVLPMPALAPPRRTMLLGMKGWLGVTSRSAWSP